MKKVSLILILLISSCSIKPRFTPDALPNAKLGEKYKQQIVIIGPVWNITKAEVLPKGDFTISFPGKNFLNIIIQGIPKKKKDITLTLCAVVRGTNISSGGEGCIEYVIKVDD